MKLIVMVDWKWGIGRKGKQPIHIATDLARFRRLTNGGTVIMGRKTLEALPDGRPLPGRRNIILSRNPNFVVDGAEVVRSVEELLKIAPDDAWVIGGESIYWALLPYCDTAYVTKVSGMFFADRHCPDLDKDPEWRLVHTLPAMQDVVVFRWCAYERVI